MLHTEKPDLRKRIQPRLDSIKSHLFRDGHMSHIDMSSGVCVSAKHASLGLSRDIGMAPGNIASDKSAWTYITGTWFEPPLLKPDASRDLLQLRPVADGVPDRAASWTAQFPFSGASPALVRGVKAKPPRSVVAAIRRTADSRLIPLDRQGVLAGVTGGRGIGDY